MIWTMPRYCDHCSMSHSVHEACYTSKASTNMATRSATVAAKLAAQTAPGEDLASSFTALSMEEQERKTREEIEELEAEICLEELQARLEFLKGNVRGSEPHG